MSTKDKEVKKPVVPSTDTIKKITGTTWNNKTTR